MKNLMLVLVISFFTINTYAQKSTNFAITKEGAVLYFYGNELDVGVQTLVYENKEGKRKSIKHSKLKLLINGNTVYYTLAINGAMNRLQEVIAFNDKYVLTKYHQTSMMYIWDREFNQIGEKILFSTVNKNQIQKNKNNLNSKIKKYFKNCSELIEAMMKNIEKNDVVDLGISYYNCGNSLDLLTNKVIEEEEKTTEESDSNREGEIDKTLMSYGIKIEGKEKVIFYHRGDYPVSGGSMSYSRKKNNPNYQIMARVRNYVYMVSAGRLFYTLKVNDKKIGAIEIIAFNDEYILGGVWKNSDKISKCYIYDRNFKLVKGDIDPKKISSVLDKYFKECPLMKSYIEENNKMNRSIASGFTYFNCGGAKDVLPGWKIPAEE